MEKSKKSKPMRPRGRPVEMHGDVVTCGIRMTREQREKLRLLGGAAWVRAQIDGATNKKPRAA